MLSGFELDLDLLFLRNLQAMTMLSVTAAALTTSKEMNSDTHIGNMISADDLVGSGPGACPGDEQAHTVFVTVTIESTVAVSVTVAKDALLHPAEKHM